MSEKLSPQEFNEGDLPEMQLIMASGEFIATPFNATLFTHLGRLAMYDHVFLQTGDEDEDTITGTYVFRTHPAFNDLAECMQEEGFPMVLNKTYVADCDINAFDNMVSNFTDDLGDDAGVPAEWT